MALFVDATAESLLGYYFGDTSFTPPATFYIGASTTTYNHDGTGGTEPTDSAYARVQVANNGTSFTAPTVLGTGGAQVTNGTQIQFPTSTASWGSITELGLYTAATGGTPVAVATLGTSVSVAANSQLTFKVGQVQFQLKFN